MKKKSFFEEVVDVLKKDARFVSEKGELLRNAVFEAAQKMDAKLLKALRANEETRKRFFTDIGGGITVFDKQQFGWVVSNRAFLPDSYTRFRNKIGLAVGDDMIASSRDVELVFPYKDCVLEGGQDKDSNSRDELFYNKVLMKDEIDRLLSAKVFSGAERFEHGKKVASKPDLKTDSLVIRGNNLLVISSLVEVYAGKVDCIYIDPPYNPQSSANTFAYNNTFNRSTWLVFMLNRLQVAKKLLSKDGVMIVAIDKNEQPRLQVLIEEVFPEYDVDCITVVHNPRGAIGTNFSYTHEFAIFVTPKGKKTISDCKLSEDEIDWNPLRNWGTESLRSDAKNCFYPIRVKNGKIVGFGNVCDNSFHPKQTEKIGSEYYIYPIDKDGVERKWRYARQTVESITHLLRVKKIEDGFDIELGKDFGVFKTVWVNKKYDANVHGTKLIKKLIPGTKFTYPKSIYTVLDCIDAVVRSKKDAIVLDFFGGSGTTGHAVQMLNSDGGNRRFILVEQMEYAKTDTLRRNVVVQKEAENSHPIVYCELAKSNQRFVERIEAAKKGSELEKIWNEMLVTGFISCKVDPAKFSMKDEDFKELSLKDKKRILMDLLDMNQLYVNYCDIDDKTFKVSAADKAFTKSFYGDK